MHYSTKIIELGSCAFRQPQADSHCKWLHGYQLKAKFWFEAEHLDKNNWVIDFGGFKEMKRLMKNQFDHTTCISKDDPHLETFKDLHRKGVCDLRIMDGVGIEKFAEWCHSVADNFAGVMSSMRCRCTQVEVFEHQDNSAIYKSIPVKEPELTQEQTEELMQEVKDMEVKDTGPDPIDEEIKLEDEKVKQQSNPPEKKLYNQHKTTGKWVDPKFKGKTTNTWLF